MNVLSLGGAGAVCRYATEDLVAFSEFDRIVIGEKNVQAAELLAGELDDPRVEVLAIDADDYDGLVQAFQGFDVVVNGLPWKYDLTVTRACIDAGVNGLDVSTEKEQWDFDAVARDRNVLFVPGVGATPGITNLMARRGADQLDMVDDIQINFAAFRCPAPAPGLLVTLLWEFHPETPERVYFKDGEFHWVGPFEGEKQVYFPGPIGEQFVYYIPHPETRTMPITLGARSVSVRGCFPPQAMRLARTMLDAGLYRSEPLTVKGIQASPFEIMFDLLLQLPENRQTPLWAYGLLVQVSGKKGRDVVKYTYWNRHPPQEEWGGSAAYYRNIAIPLSIGAQMIARGEVQRTGVIAPESAFDPTFFIHELEKRRIIVHEQVETRRAD